MKKDFPRALSCEKKGRAPRFLRERMLRRRTRLEVKSVYLCETFLKGVWGKLFSKSFPHKKLPPKGLTMLKAIIFDFDGTIADTISAIREGVNLTMEKYGYPQHDDAAVLSFINNGARMLIRRAMPAHLQGDEELVTRVLADYDECYGQVYHHTDTAYDGVIDAICDLHDRLGLKIAVLSNKQDAFVKHLCAQILPENYCDAAFGVQKGMPTKPDARFTQIILDALGVRPDECLLVGDSDVDILTAKNAGLGHVGVSWGYRNEQFLREHGATDVARTARELYSLIEQKIKEKEQ